MANGEYHPNKWRGFTKLLLFQFLAMDYGAVVWAMNLTKSQTTKIYTIQYTNSCTTYIDSPYAK